VFQLAEEDRMVGGMMEMPAEMKDAPPHWLPYFQVADVDAAVARASELGGKICNPPMDIPNVGRIAMIADPQGATFAVAKFIEK
jgi:predicted enzyme related to lactoylglutathione lyase